MRDRDVVARAVARGVVVCGLLVGLGYAVLRGVATRSLAWALSAPPNRATNGVIWQSHATKPPTATLTVSVRVCLVACV